MTKYIKYLENLNFDIKTDFVRYTGLYLDNKILNDNTYFYFTKLKIEMRLVKKRC